MTRKTIAFTIALLIICAGLGGCGRTEPQPLSEDELAYFNGNDFFNGEYLCIRNQFLSSLYDKPEKIDLFELFYVGSGFIEICPEEERMAVVAENGWEQEPDCGCTKISRAAMDEVLRTHTGKSFDETEKVGLEKFTYLEQYDAYYYFHGDTNYRPKISFSGGETEGSVVRLFYRDRFLGGGDKTLTLRKQDGGYLFASNLVK